MTTRALQITELLSPVVHPTTGAVCDGYTVEFYAAGTTDAKNVWTEPEKSNAYTSVTLGSGAWEAGTAQVYGDGNYKIIVKDGNDATVLEWDNVKVQANSFAVSTKTGNYTVTPDDDVILVNTSGGDVTISLQAVANFTHPVTIKKIHASNTLTIDPNGAETIDGDSTLTMRIENRSITIYPDTNASIWRRDLEAASEINLNNNEFLTARNAADSAEVNILKLNASDKIEFEVESQAVGFPTTAAFAAAAKIMCGVTNSTVIWIKVNSAPPGWKLSDGTSGRTLATCGTGSGDEFRSDVGNDGSWTVSGFSHVHTGPEHNHKAFNYVYGADCKAWDTDGNAIDIPYAASGLGSARSIELTNTNNRISGDFWTNNDGDGNTGSGGGSNDGSWRPESECGKLYILDVA